MDSHSTEFEGGLIDAPLRVMNPHLWKNTLSLAAHLGIQTFPVRTYMACSWLFEDRTETWLTTSRSRIGNFPIINNRKGLQQYGWRLVKGMLQLKAAITRFFKSKDQDITLAEFINQNDIEEVFWHGAVMPVLYTICTCNPKTIGEWPAKPLLIFLRQLTDGDALLRIQGGHQHWSISWLKALIFKAVLRLPKFASKMNKCWLKMRLEIIKSLIVLSWQRQPQKLKNFRIQRNLQMTLLC